MDKITYQIEIRLDLEEFRELLMTSTLGERRPVNEKDRLQKMLEHGNLIITARLGKQLVGVARSLTDQAFCTYLSDLAVHVGHQKQGIGKELIRQTKAAFPQAKVILISAPKAVGFYPRIGMSKHENCYILDDIEKLR